MICYLSFSNNEEVYVIDFKFKGDFKVAMDVFKVSVVTCSCVANTIVCMHNCKIVCMFMCKCLWKGMRATRALVVSQLLKSRPTNFVKSCKLKCDFISERLRSCPKFYICAKPIHNGSKIQMCQFGFVNLQGRGRVWGIQLSFKAPYMFSTTIPLFRANHG